MAGYGYKTKGYNSYNGMVSPADGQSRPMHTEYECSDHVCRPVIIDAEGRKQPLVSYTPSYVVQTERIIEHVRTPLVEYDHSYPTKDYYGVDNNRKARPTSPEYDHRYPTKDYNGVGNRKARPTSPEYDHRYPTKEYSGVDNNRKARPTSPDYDHRYPTKDYYGVDTNRKARPTSPDYDHHYPTKDYYGVDNNRKARPTSPDYDHPRKAEDFVTKVHPDVSRPTTRPGFLNSTNWHAAPHSGYGNSNNLGYKEMDKPNGNTIRYENFDAHHPRPNHGLAKHSSQDPPLTRTTNDIGSAMEYLTEAVKPSHPSAALPQRRFAVSEPKRDTYGNIIDSKDAEKRYGNFNLSSRPLTARGTYSTTLDSREGPLSTRETYSTTIDSREAMRKYGGTVV